MTAQVTAICRLPKDRKYFLPAVVAGLDGQQIWARKSKKFSSPMSQFGMSHVAFRKQSSAVSVEYSWGSVRTTPVRFALKAPSIAQDYDDPNYSRIRLTLPTQSDMDFFLPAYAFAFGLAVELGYIATPWTNEQTVTLLLQPNTEVAVGIYYSPPSQQQIRRDDDFVGLRWEGLVLPARSTATVPLTAPRF